MDDHILKAGQTTLTESSGMSCVVGQYLGGGGQGEVYLAQLGDKSVALKWYFPDSATPEQEAALKALVDAGPPNEKFLWPMELVRTEGVQGFGYVMKLREDRYKGIVDLMRRRIHPRFRSLTTAGLNLAASYSLLHAKGLCYRDISFGNVFFDPNTGDVLICDNDNVTVDKSSVSGVLGTPRFMAPEVVCGKALPSTQTDLFSLAVLLFYMFMIHHPLEGKRELDIHSFDLPAMTKLYGEEPLFIFDPQDQSNAPVSGVHDNALLLWPIYPESIRRLFIKAFTEGLKDPEHGRVREGEWRYALANLRDWIFYCTHCSAENFYDGTALRAGGGKLPPCWNCKKEPPLPFRIRLGGRIVVLNNDTELFPHHLDSQRPYDFSRALASVTQHPNDPKIWGLKNLSDQKWVTTNSAGVINEIDPGRSIKLDTGVKIQFGTTEGEINL
jgi:DNA-binding helix-hairpin-helix protein with protein kinase domain